MRQDTATRGALSDGLLVFERTLMPLARFGSGPKVEAQQQGGEEKDGKQEVHNDQRTF